MGIIDLEIQYSSNPEMYGALDEVQSRPGWRARYPTAEAFRQAVEEAVTWAPKEVPPRHAGATKEEEAIDGLLADLRKDDLRPATVTEVGMGGLSDGQAMPEPTADEATERLRNARHGTPEEEWDDETTRVADVAGIPEGAMMLGRVGELYVFESSHASTAKRWDS